eukprot:1150056-Pelagomonas_calceolata.AAC.4
MESDGQDGQDVAKVESDGQDGQDVAKIDGAQQGPVAALQLSTNKLPLLLNKVVHSNGRTQQSTADAVDVQFKKK